MNDPTITREQLRAHQATYRARSVPGHYAHIIRWKPYALANVLPKKGGAFGGGKATKRHRQLYVNA
jgi:hypothetical protein